MHCMYWHRILEGTRAWRNNYRDGEGDTAHKNFGIIPLKNMIGSIFLRPKHE